MRGLSVLGRNIQRNTRGKSLSVKAPSSQRLAELRDRLKKEDSPSFSSFSEVKSPSNTFDDFVPHNSSTKLLEDRFGRFHDYLRISLTERCNLRCTYCMPADGTVLTPSELMLSTDEIITLASYFVKNGVKKIRLTGGEPLVRKEIVNIIQHISSLPNLESVGITTNGLLLSRLLPKLQEAGLTSVNVSLDTLIASKFESITRRKGFNVVKKSIDAALLAQIQGNECRETDILKKKKKLSVKVNCVVMRGMNEDELVDFVALTKEKPLDVRFIEWMPFDSNQWDSDRFVAYSEMIDILRKDGIELDKCDVQSPNDTTKWYRARGHEGRIGFITSMSEHFCGTCNRLRITGDGFIKACLFGEKEFDLKPSLRSGDNKSLEAAVRKSLGLKDFSLGGHKDMNAISESENRSMIRIGG